MRELVENRAFRRLWLAGTLFRLAAGLRRVAVPWLVLVETGSPVQLGIALAVGSLDLVATPFVGPVVDRHRRRTVVAVSVVGYAATLLALPALAAVGVLTLPVVYVALFALGVTHFAYHNARHAWVPELVADLDAANAAIHGVGAFGSALFVAAGGAITALTTPLTAVGVAGLAALTALVPLVGLPESAGDTDDSADRPGDDARSEGSAGTPADGDPTDAATTATDEPRTLRDRLAGYLRETRAGLRAVGRHGLWPLVVASVGINLVAPAYGLLFAAVGDRFDTALAYTALLVGYDLGKVAGNAVVPRLDWPRVVAVERGIALSGAATLGVGLVGWIVADGQFVADGRLVVAVGALTLAAGVAGATQPVFNVPSDGLVQTAVPNADRGTVVTVTNALYQLPFPVAYLAGGVIAERVSPFTGFAAAGVFLLCVAVVAAATLGGSLDTESATPAD